MTATTAARHVLSAAAFLLVAAACARNPGPGEEPRLSPTELARKELAENRARWDTAAVQGYGYVLRRTCFCPAEATGPVRVEVRGGVPVSVTTLATGAPAGDPFPRYDTVQELFALIEDEIAKEPYRLVATYDRELGYPIGLQVDPDRKAQDDEFGWVVAQFQRVEAPAAQP